MFQYKTKGTCAMMINLDVDTEGVIQKVEFVGGCNGNTQGVAMLVQGMKATDAIDKLSGIRCNMKTTSCPDQLARALEAALKAQTEA